MSPFGREAGWGSDGRGGFLEMSADERERSHLVRASVDARLGQREALECLGIGLRQFKRLVPAWRRDGDAGPGIAPARPPVEPASGRRPAGLDNGAPKRQI